MQAPDARQERRHQPQCADGCQVSRAGGPRPDAEQQGQVEPGQYRRDQPPIDIDGLDVGRRDKRRDPVTPTAPMRAQSAQPASRGLYVLGADIARTAPLSGALSAVSASLAGEIGEQRRHGVPLLPRQAQPGRRLAASAPAEARRPGHSPQAETESPDRSTRQAGSRRASARGPSPARSRRVERATQRRRFRPLPSARCRRFQAGCSVVRPAAASRVSSAPTENGPIVRRGSRIASAAQIAPSSQSAMPSLQAGLFGSP